MSQPTSPAPAPAKAPRSAAERIIVWAVIGIGLLVIIVEGQAHLAHAAALEKLQNQLKKASESDGGMSEKDVVSLMGSKVPESQKLDHTVTGMGASRVDIYTFNGLGLRARKIYVYYGVDGKANQPAEVMEVASVPAETPAEVLARAPKPDPNAPLPPGVPGGPPAMMGGPGGPPSGGRSGPARPAAEGDAEKKDTTADVPKSDEPKSEEAKPEAPKADADKPEGEKKE